MSRPAATAAMLPTDWEEQPSAADLLADGAFQARLAKARGDRERALADLGGEEAPLRRRKPWERHAAIRSGPSQDGATPEGLLILTEKDRLKSARILAKGGASIPAAVPAPTDARTPARRTYRGLHQRNAVLFVAGGFLAGIVIGAGITLLLTYSSISAPSSLAGNLENHAGEPTAATDLPDDRAATSGTGYDGASVTSVIGTAVVAESPPILDVEGPAPVTASTAVPTEAGTPLAAETDVSFRPLPNLAPVPDRASDPLLPQQANPPFPPSAGFGRSVFLQAPSGATDSAVTEVRGALDRMGFTIADTRRVDLSISRSNVRFFHAADATAAVRLAEEIGAVARDFSAYRPSPPAGTIEIWLAGRSAGTTRSVSSPQRAERDEQLLLLRRLIIEKLRAAGDLRP